MVLLIDNYDSFSYNLFQMVGELEPDIRVIRNDEMSLSEIEAMKPDHIILSPGPGRPEDAGVTCEVAGGITDIPILGVCLGHQAICSAYGARITYAKHLMHGKQSEVSLDVDSPLFRGLKDGIRVARYHSLAVDPDTVPACLKVISETSEGEVMAVCHTDYPVFGVQFHPESILTPDGRRMLSNFLCI